MLDLLISILTEFKVLSNELLIIEIATLLIATFLVAFLKNLLHGILSFGIIVKQCPGGEIGRRSGLKIHR